MTIFVFIILLSGKDDTKGKFIQKLYKRYHALLTQGNALIISVDIIAIVGYPAAMSCSKRLVNLCTSSMSRHPWVTYT